jgi:transglutaminase/protease-like cytokinesis protein 3
MSRFRLLHDWVATHIHYDVEMLESGHIRDQDAQTVLASRKAVCAGYARLLQALGKAAGLDIHYVVGDARGSAADLTGEGHAWNVVTIDAKSYLVDVTWNAGFVGVPAGESRKRFTRAYSTDYLFTPPQVFAIKHYPDEPKWQLLDKPLTRGEFFRAPVLQPSFYAHGLKLISPDRSQVTARGSINVVVERSSKDWLLATATTAEEEVRCKVTRSERFEIECPLSAKATYEITLFHSTRQYSTYMEVGRLSVLNDQ